MDSLEPEVRDVTRRNKWKEAAGKLEGSTLDS